MRVLTRISIIICSSLAQHQSTIINGSNNSNNNISNSSDQPTCKETNPCGELQAAVSHSIILIPLGIALLFSTIGALPVLLCRSKYQVKGVRSCLWVLIELWIHLIITYLLFQYDKAQAYVWALHSSAQILTAWQSKDRAPYPGLQKLICVLGVWCIGLFAWQHGPPVGLAAWYSDSDAQCGWKVHLTAVIGVEFVGWVLAPLEALVN